jgi:hypothetical protein
MIALGDLNPVDSVRAELQNQIGNFLQGRTRLNRLMGVPNLQVQGQAQGLYAVQTALETRLQDEITPKLQAISTGVWTTSDVISLGGFTAQLVKQINDVGSLERQAGISGAVPSGFGFDLSTIVIGGIVILGLGIMSGVFFSGRSQTSP